MAKVKLIPRSKFCELLELKPSVLRTYISRGTLKESQQGFLNVYNPTNQQWIIDYCDKRNMDYKPVFLQKAGESLPKKKKEIRLEGFGPPTFGSVELTSTSVFGRNCVFSSLSNPVCVHCSILPSVSIPEKQDFDKIFSVMF